LAPTSDGKSGDIVKEPPKPRSNFVLRAATAVVLVPGVVGLVHLGGVAFSLFAVALAGLCASEFAGLMRKGNRAVSPFGAVLAAAAIPAAAAFGLPVGLAAAIALGALAASETIRSDHSLERLSNTAFGAALIGAGLAPLIAIRALVPHGEALALLVFVSAWLTDTMAYAVGKSVGHRKIAPMLSPNKTWEGSIGGFFGALIAAAAFHFAAGTPWLAALAVSAVVGSLGQLSGFMNSMIKRLNGAKDSGTLLPGHGGFLDRFDTLVLSSAVVYALLLLLR
jgi:phosphatidate cytidylyltransferase